MAKKRTPSQYDLLEKSQDLWRQGVELYADAGTFAQKVAALKFCRDMVMQEFKILEKCWEEEAIQRLERLQYGERNVISPPPADGSGHGAAH